MNRFKSFVQVSGLLLMSWILFSSCSETKEQEHYVVVLSMDGFRSDYPQRAHTPILDSLARVGVKAAFRPCYPSVTFPNHYSMATGLHPDHHGLVHNTFWATDLDKPWKIRLTTGVNPSGIRPNAREYGQPLISG